MTVKGIFLCLRESRNAVWQLYVLWGLQKEPNAFLSLGSCGMWSFPPLFSLLVSPPLSFFLPRTPKSSGQRRLQNKPLFFPNQSLAPWLLRVTLLPNMHENVTVCLEAVCRVCKFKPQSEDQRQTETSTTWETFMAALIGQLHKLPANSRKTSPWSKAVKNHSLHLG